MVGWHDADGIAVTDLTLIVNGQRVSAEAYAMPRLDVMAGMRPDADLSDPDAADLAAFRSGFWAIAATPSGSDDVVIEAEALLADGTLHRAPVAVIERAGLPSRLAVPSGHPGGDGPLVAVCMATYEPDPALLERQIESIRAQDHGNWFCVISDDRSSDERFAQLQEMIAGDERFLLSRSPARLGFYRNFERALALAPREAEFVALADQDDRWHSDKLSSLLSAIGSAELIYSDARIVSESGVVLSDTFWQTRRNEHDDMLSLLVANSVTGAASLLTRDVADAALPFPAAQFTHFHDHWIALVALARGEIRFYERPVYDYVQHGQATLGHAGANRMPSMRSRLRKLRHGLRTRVGRWRFHYFANALRLQQVATVLLDRYGDQMQRPKRRALERYLRLESSSTTLLAFALRGARELASRRPATLGAEWSLSYAFVWRRAAALTARFGPGSRLRIGAIPPVSFREPPSRVVPDVPTVEDMVSKIAPVEWHLDERVEPQINVLIPEIDLKHFFGGYIGKFNLALRLAEHGQRVRIVTTDRNVGLARDWERRVAAYEGLSDVFDRVEVAFAREQGGVTISPSDRFVATTWRTAHVAKHAANQTDQARFLYLIQEYEPLTCPMGSWEALAAETYGFDHAAMFSTELLREYFREHRLGVYAGSLAGGDAQSCSFQNAITAIAPPTVADLGARDGRSLLFYARPEPHAARNLFEIGVMALRHALDRGYLDGWGLHGIGTVEGGQVIDLGGGATVDLLPRTPQSEYGALLAGHDVGLSLMYTPHPSLVPLEMASAGLLTVTNTFENKTADKLTAISPNLIAAEPNPDAIAEAIGVAASGVGDYARRVDGSRVEWSSDWRASLDDRLITTVLELLGS